MLTLTDVTKTYEKTKVPAIQHISVSIETGEFVGILGRSGAGKSTLIRCMNGLVTPTSGSIYWNGAELTSLNAKQLLQTRRSIGMIFQHFNLIDRLDVRTNVIVGKFGSAPLWRGLFGIPSKEDINRADKALERVGLSHFATQRVEELSGGQRQRVAIARVLMQQPKLLLGDEPVASLDPITSIQIMDLLKEIHQQENMTSIINLHDVELAKRYCTRIIGIASGRIVFDGSPEEVTDDTLEGIYIPDDLIKHP